MDWINLYEQYDFEPIDCDEPDYDYDDDREAAQLDYDEVLDRALYCIEQRALRSA